MNWIRFKELATKEKFDSTNAWGFAGSAGTKYTLNLQENEFEYKTAKHYYRHANPSPWKSYKVNGEEVTKKEFEAKLTDLLK